MNEPDQPTVPTVRILTSEEWDHEYHSDPEHLLPPKRKDDRRLPGIITGWAVGFDETYFKWRVWDGTAIREDDPERDTIWGYWESYHTLGEEVCSSACCIPYPEGKPEEEFIEWANEAAEKAHAQFAIHAH